MNGTNIIECMMLRKSNRFYNNEWMDGAKTIE